ncbi:unnamed protein product [Rotaria sp. Silwood2]|nr:unnamed protein product [Rotaria sp. Silwood2]CAF3011929.1 unnamed protein product [Rotaria sp. Silwood2]CAF3277772.1 unnamed protein product [Rotaria sp. Silwood2]CAF3364869.1 unnamed protein product [Rotaria sp. Silwood2]CAF4131689.1 unnamed protein product [Rotaria sp. Silwood2]
MITFQESASIDSSEAFDDKPNGLAKNSSYNNNVRPRNSANSNGGSDTLKIIGLILGILLLIGFISGAIYFITRKYYFNKSSSSSVNVENENEDSYSLGEDQTQQSLAATSMNETNTDVFTNLPSKEDKTFVTLHSPDGNKRQKADTSMVFNEDM